MYTMKKMILTTAFCCSLFACTALSASAQSTDAAKEPYWVVETNTVTRDHTIVRFYSQQHELVYEEKLQGVHLDATRKRTRKLLNKALKGVMNNSILAGEYFKGYPSKKPLALL